MASLASSINNGLAVGNDGLFTDLLREVQGKSKDAGFAIAYVILALGAILIVALDTLMAAVLESDIIAWLTL